MLRGNTKKTLTTFEPTMLPIAKPGSFLSAASRETTNSGKEVPIATTVTPTTKGEILKASEVLIAESIKARVENKSSRIPKTIDKTAKTIFQCFNSFYQKNNKLSEDNGGLAGFSEDFPLPLLTILSL